MIGNSFDKRSVLCYNKFRVKGVKIMKKMLKYSCIFCLAAAVLLMAGCGAKQDAGGAFDAMMQALISGDLEKISAYYQIQDQDLLDQETKSVVTTAAAEVLKKTQYRVTSVEKEDAGSVKITAAVTTVDFSKVVSTYLGEVMNMVVDADYQAKLPTMTQEEYQKCLADKMAEVIRRDDLGTVETALTVTMVKEDGTWVPGSDKDAFFEALFGNLIKAVSSLA